MKTVPIQSKILRFVIIVGFVLGTVVLSGKMTVTGYFYADLQKKGET